MPDQPRIAHVGVAVPDISAALAFYRDVLGITPGRPETADGATIVSLPMGESEIELLSSDDPGEPHRQVPGEARGPGIHHICYRVADLDRALQACRALRIHAGGSGPSHRCRGPAHCIRASQIHGRHPARAHRVSSSGVVAPSQGRAGLPAAASSTSVMIQAPLIFGERRGICFYAAPFAVDRHHQLAVIGVTGDAHVGDDLGAVGAEVGLDDDQSPLVVFGVSRFRGRPAVKSPRAGTSGSNCCLRRPS
jgi:catechol 2,3-dioxygenase-like lactoylglutathione lyase family enzyme